MNTPTRILIVDDHAGVREALHLLLAEQPELCIVGEARNGELAVELSRTLCPDLVLMDLRMPGIGGIEATRRIRATQPRPQVLILTSQIEDSYLHQALQAGALGTLQKNISRDCLLRAIAEASTGKFTPLASRLC